jgi:hypothetical protein
MPNDLLREGGEAAVRRALDWLTGRSADALEPGLGAEPAAAFNLTVFGHLLGTPLEPDLAGHVLLLEDVSEHMYRTDRAMFHLAASPMRPASPASASAAAARCRSTTPISARARRRCSASGAAARESPISAAPTSAMTRPTRSCRSESPERTRHFLRRLIQTDPPERQEATRLLSERPMTRFSLALILAAAAPAFSVPASAGAQAVAMPSVRAVLAGVRKATGAPALERLSVGFAIEGEGDPLLLGTRHGEVKLGGEAVYDGEVAWRFDERQRAGVPLNLRQLEKLAWPLWVRSGWWLNPASEIAVEPLAGESDSELIALRLKRPGGVVPATLFVDRRTFLPTKLVVPYDRGPMTMLFSDWRPALGGRIAFAVESTYRDTQRRQATLVRPLTRVESAAFALPAPQDYRFDPSAPALVPVQYGTPFAGGARPHVYVTPEVDGRAIGPFLLDSGADGMMIDEKLADSLGMPVIGRTNSIGADGNPRPATFRRGKSFRIGRLSIDNPVYLALDFSKNNAPPGTARAGVIGYDIFARAAVEFAGAGERVAICDPGRYRLPAGAQWQRLYFMDSAPAIRTRFAGGEGLFQVDTGSAATVEFYPGVAPALLAQAEARELTSSGAGGTYAVRIGRLPWLDLGPHRLPGVEAAFRTSGIGRDGGTGLIGRDLLRPFTTVFDYRHRRIAFARGAAPAAGVAKRCR